MQIKTILRYYLIYVRIVKFNIKATTHVREDVNDGKHSFIAGRSVNL